MKWFQEILTLPAFTPGYHLITQEVENAIAEVRNLKIGQLHIFIQHTSAALTLNENADPSVRQDFKTFVEELIPRDYPHFTHTQEGPDDMPSHIKASFFDTALQIPVHNGKLALGTWQGIYLCEFRDHAGPRKLVLTAFGE